jgi:hypothetical protein
LNSNNQYQILGYQRRLFDFIKAHVPSNINIRAEIEFTNYRNMRDNFENSELLEKGMIDDLIVFWNFTKIYPFTLSTLAKRLFECSAISISCEKAFSTMNLIYTKFRNRLRSNESISFILYTLIKRFWIDLR